MHRSRRRCYVGLQLYIEKPLQGIEAAVRAALAPEVVKLHSPRDRNALLMRLLIRDATDLEPATESTNKTYGRSLQSQLAPYALQDHFHLEAVEDFTSDGDLLSSPGDKPQRGKGRFCGEARVDPHQGQALRSGKV